MYDVHWFPRTRLIVNRDVPRGVGMYSGRPFMQYFGHFFGDSCILLGLDGLDGPFENLEVFAG